MVHTFGQHGFQSFIRGVCGCTCVGGEMRQMSPLPSVPLLGPFFSCQSNIGHESVKLFRQVVSSVWL